MLSDIMLCYIISTWYSEGRGDGRKGRKGGGRKEGVERPPVNDAHHPFFSSLSLFLGCCVLFILSCCDSVNVQRKVYLVSKV